LLCEDACHNCVLLQISMEDKQAMNMEGCQQFPFFV
jgi:hypothetical protein